MNAQVIPLTRVAHALLFDTTLSERTLALRSIAVAQGDTGTESGQSALRYAGRLQRIAEERALVEAIAPIIGSWEHAEETVANVLCARELITGRASAGAVEVALSSALAHRVRAFRETFPQLHASVICAAARAAAEAWERAR